MDTQRRDTNGAARSGRAWLAAVVALGLLATPVGAVVPSGGGSVSATYYEINVDAGFDAFDPHLSGDLVSYTAGLKIRYYDFASGADAQVPSPPGAFDSLSDVSAGRIVFTRQELGEQAVMFYEVGVGTTEVDPSPGARRSDAAIGGATVAFIDKTVASTGNLRAASVSGTGSAEVTHDGRVTRRPSIAPAGDLIVYESCVVIAACSIRLADWNGSVWTVANVTEDGPEAEAEANPDTDGVVIVYDADRGGDREIAWTPVGGGPEQVLEMDGIQRNPSVSGGMISFESVGGNGVADLFVYRIADNRLFQVTSSPSVDQALNDIFVLSSGQVRVVWGEGEFGYRDVRGADLTLPPVGPTYTFGGFQSPVDPLPTLNSMKAGAAVPVKFSLDGDHGLDIFTAGYPGSQAVACDSTAPVDGVEQTVSAGGSGLTYDPTSGLYTYVWKTEKAWAGTCRLLVLSLVDGTVAQANFAFR